MDRIYRHILNASYKPNEGRYLQIKSAKDLYIQNITVLIHDNPGDSFQVKFPNVFANYPLGAVSSFCISCFIASILHLTINFNYTLKSSIMPLGCTFPTVII